MAADPAQEAEARLAALRDALQGSSDVPAAVWEDARRQLAGMLGGLQELVRSAPMLADASAAVEPPAGATPASTEVSRPAPGAHPEAAPRPGGLAQGRARAGQTQGDRGVDPGAALCALSIEDLADRIHRREVSPVEVTRAVLDRIAAEIWSRPVVAGLPLRAAHAAQSLGFLSPGDAVLAYEAAGWLRLDGTYGAVAVRRDGRPALRLA